jgi:transcriptional regulator with XRE-family HTH domain
LSFPEITGRVYLYPNGSKGLTDCKLVNQPDNIDVGRTETLHGSQPHNMMIAEVSTMIENVGRNMKRLREQYGVTQEELAKIAELSRDTISKIEQNKRNPSFDSLDRIARFFNVAPVDLFGSPDEQKVHSTTAILDRIDATLDRLEEYRPKLEQIHKLAWEMEGYSPYQLEHLEEQLHAIFSYFQPYTPTDEDGVPETDRSGRVIGSASRYSELPVKEIESVYKQLQEIKAFNVQND